MIKALLKKQLLETFAGFVRKGKNGKKCSKAAGIGFGLLYIYVFGVFISMFYMLADTLCAPLSMAGFGWLYFAIMGMISLLMGVVGSVFITYSTLYQAKDNDLLLSMPIPVSKILLTRLFGVYVMGLLFEVLVMIPTLIVWINQGSAGGVGIILSIVIPLVLSLLVLSLSCILGWVVAQVAGRMRGRGKSFAMVALSLGFIAIYYYGYSKAYAALTDILMNPVGAAEAVKSILYPFYHMGLAAEGNFDSMLIFTAIIAGVFAVVYLLLSRSFLKMATTKKGEMKRRYKEKAVKTAGVEQALLRKELKRFTSSANYMMNCGLGLVFMVVAAVFLLIKGDLILQYMPLFSNIDEGIIPMGMTAMLCMMASMNDITAPSVSLEGKNLWILQVLPVDPWKVLKAKIQLQLILSAIPMLFLIVSMLIVVRPEAGFVIVMPITVVLFAVFMALLGLVLNLKAPNLTWTNEIVPIKQSMSVMLTMFGGMGLVLGFGVGYYLLMDVVDALIYLIGVDVLLASATIGFIRWLKYKGSKIFASL